MRILHINCNYLGTTLHQCMIEHLDKLGIDNTVYVPTYDKSNAVIKPNTNVCVSQCFNKWDRVCFDYKQNKIIKDIQSKIDVSRYDCIHAYTLFTDGNCARILSKKYNIPYVVAVRNTDVNAFFKYMLHLRQRGNKILQDASRVFFLSESYKNQVLIHYVKKELQEKVLNKTDVIPNGLDDFWFNNRFFKRQSRNIDNNMIKLIYAGRIDKNKNITTTQKAVDLLRSEGYEATLTVIGRIDDKNVYKQIKKHEFTRTLPVMSKEELLKQYRQHDIFIMPSITESFGLVYVEALSQGLPIIYTKGQGFDRQIKDSFIGYDVEAKNPLEIKEKIISIIKHGCCTNNVDLSKYRWDYITKDYVKIYEAAICY